MGEEHALRLDKFARKLVIESERDVQRPGQPGGQPDRAAEHREEVAELPRRACRPKEIVDGRRRHAPAGGAEGGGGG